TTTIEICEGLLPADSGSVEVLGRRWESDARDLRELLGIQLQDTQLSEKLTVDETLTLFQSFYRDAVDVGEVIEKVELGEKRSSRVGTLSGGQKQRLRLRVRSLATLSFFFSTSQLLVSTRSRADSSGT